MFSLLLASNSSGSWKYSAWELLVVGVSAGIVVGLVWYYTCFWLKQRRSRDAGEPWLCRKDWAKGEIRGEKAFGSRFFFWIVAGWGNLLVLWLFFGYPMGKEFLPVFIGFNLACVLFYRKILKKRQVFGRSLFKMSSLPGRIGGALEGKICVEKKMLPGDSYIVQLLCFKYVEHLSGSDTVCQKAVIWEAEQEVAAKSCDDPDWGSAIPVCFQIPGSCPETGDLTRQKRVQWELSLDAKSFVSDSTVIFQVPIYKVKNARAKHTG